MKRKNIAAVLLLAVLLIGALLWYTRPRSWTSIAGDGEVSSLSGTLCVSGIRDASPFMDTWTLDTLEPGDPALDAVLAALENSTYRASLRNFLPGDRFSENGVSGSVLMAVVFDDRSFQTTYLSSSGAFVGGRSDIRYRADKRLYDTMEEIFKTYGTTS